MDVFTIGNSADGPYGYQMNAFCAGGSSVRPVLLGDVFTGCAGSNWPPASTVTESMNLVLKYALLSATKSGHPKLPGRRACPISSYPMGPRPAESTDASGPTSPQ